MRRGRRHALVSARTAPAPAAHANLSLILYNSNELIAHPLSTLRAALIEGVKARYAARCYTTEELAARFETRQTLDERFLKYGEERLLETNLVDPDGNINGKQCLKCVDYNQGGCKAVSCGGSSDYKKFRVMHPEPPTLQRMRSARQTGIVDDFGIPSSFRGVAFLSKGPESLERFSWVDFITGVFRDVKLELDLRHGLKADWLSNADGDEHPYCTNDRADARYVRTGAQVFLQVIGSKHWNSKSKPVCVQCYEFNRCHAEGNVHKMHSCSITNESYKYNLIPAHSFFELGDPPWKSSEVACDTTLPDMPTLSVTDGDSQIMVVQDDGDLAPYVASDWDTLQSLCEKTVNAFYPELDKRYLTKDVACKTLVQKGKAHKRYLQPNQWFNLEVRYKRDSEEEMCMMCDTKQYWSFGYKYNDDGKCWKHKCSTVASDHEHRHRFRFK